MCITQNINLSQQHSHQSQKFNPNFFTESYRQTSIDLSKIAIECNNQIKKVKKELFFYSIFSCGVNFQLHIVQSRIKNIKVVEAQRTFHLLQETQRALSQHFQVQNIKISGSIPLPQSLLLVVNQMIAISDQVLDIICREIKLDNSKPYQESILRLQKTLYILRTELKSKNPDVGTIIRLLLQVSHAVYNNPCERAKLFNHFAKGAYKMSQLSPLIQQELIKSCDQLTIKQIRQLLSKPNKLTKFLQLQHQKMLTIDIKDTDISSSTSFQQKLIKNLAFQTIMYNGHTLNTFIDLAQQVKYIQDHFGIEISIAVHPQIYSILSLYYDCGPNGLGLITTTPENIEMMLKLGLPFVLLPAGTPGANVASGHNEGIEKGKIIAQRGNRSAWMAMLNGVKQVPISVTLDGVFPYRGEPIPCLINKNLPSGYLRSRGPVSHCNLPIIQPLLSYAKIIRSAQTENPFHIRHHHKVSFINVPEVDPKLLSLPQTTQQALLQDPVVLRAMLNWVSTGVAPTNKLDKIANFLNAFPGFKVSASNLSSLQVKNLPSELLKYQEELQATIDNFDRFRFKITIMISCTYMHLHDTTHHKTITKSKL